MDIQYPHRLTTSVPDYLGDYQGYVRLLTAMVERARKDCKSSSPIRRGEAKQFLSWCAAELGPALADSGVPDRKYFINRPWS